MLFQCYEARFTASPIIVVACLQSESSYHQVKVWLIVATAFANALLVAFRRQKPIYTAQRYSGAKSRGEYRNVQGPPLK